MVRIRNRIGSQARLRRPAKRKDATNRSWRFLFLERDSGLWQLLQARFALWTHIVTALLVLMSGPYEFPISCSGMFEVYDILAVLGIWDYTWRLMGHSKVTTYKWPNHHPTHHWGRLYKASQGDYR